jgi:ferrous iron transport protein A
VSERPPIPLGFMEPGATGVLVEIRGLRHHHRRELYEPPAVQATKHRHAHLHDRDRGHRLEHRLQHMGLAPGAPVRVIQNALTGPVIIGVKDTRLALARGLAARIMVRPDTAGPESSSSAPDSTRR